MGHDFYRKFNSKNNGNEKNTKIISLHLQEEAQCYGHQVAKNAYRRSKFKLTSNRRLRANIFGY